MLKKKRKKERKMNAGLLNLKIKRKELLSRNILKRLSVRLTRYSGSEQALEFDSQLRSLIDYLALHKLLNLSVTQHLLG